MYCWPVPHTNDRGPVPPVRPTALAGEIIQANWGKDFGVGTSANLAPFQEGRHLVLLNQETIGWD